MAWPGAARLGPPARGHGVPPARGHGTSPARPLGPARLPLVPFPCARSWCPGAPAPTPSLFPAFARPWRPAVALGPASTPLGAAPSPRRGVPAPPDELPCPVPYARLGLVPVRDTVPCSARRSPPRRARPRLSPPGTRPARVACPRRPGAASPHDPDAPASAASAARSPRPDLAPFWPRRPSRGPTSLGGPAGLPLLPSPPQASLGGPAAAQCPVAFPPARCAWSVETVAAIPGGPRPSATPSPKKPPPSFSLPPYPLAHDSHFPLHLVAERTRPDAVRPRHHRPIHGEPQLPFFLPLALSSPSPARPARRGARLGPPARGHGVPLGAPQWRPSGASARPHASPPRALPLRAVVVPWRARPDPLHLPRVRPAMLARRGARPGLDPARRGALPAARCPRPAQHAPLPSPLCGSAPCPAVARSPSRRSDPRRGALALASPRPARGSPARPARMACPRRPGAASPRDPSAPASAAPAARSPRLGLAPFRPRRVRPARRGALRAPSASAHCPGVSPRPWHGPASTRCAHPRPPVLPSALMVARPLPLHDIAPAQRGPGPAWLQLSRPRCPCIARRVRSSAPAYITRLIS
eukprot:XP_020400924.1 basic proline-rich protein-like [Zea mays]